MNIHSITLTQIFWLALILALAWVFLHLILRLAKKVFACGCSLLFVAAVVMILLRIYYKG